MLGGWGAWLIKIGLTIGVVLHAVAIMLCCVFPCIKSLLVKAAVKQLPMITGADESGPKGKWTSVIEYYYDGEEVFGKC